MPDGPRVRFSPAPTGSLHVGGARTALFNWLYARHHHGTFVLRVEDTDVARSRPEWVEGIQDALRWLGLDWDEGPILQSGRFELYRAAANRLLAEGHAYECFCTTEEVKARGDAARAEGRPPGYDGRCRDLTEDERAALRAEGREASIRFRTPDEGASTFTDVIRGDVAVEWANIPDFVIVRSDGNPLFFLANAVDDLDMGITHVIRGEDLIDTTHRVLVLRRALLSPSQARAPVHQVGLASSASCEAGWQSHHPRAATVGKAAAAALGASDQPVYAHLPLILAADRAKLSKRHGAVALEEFRDEGYLPEAVLNYLALLGWGPGDDREIFDKDKLVAEFDLDRVTQSAAIFDHKKLDWVNGEWIRRLALSELEARLAPMAKERFGDAIDPDVLHEAVRIGQERAITLNSLIDQMWFLFVDEDDFEIALESWEKVQSTERVEEIFDAATKHLETCEWTHDGIDLRPVLEALGIKPRKGLPAVYAAIEGHHTGLPLFESIQLLGQERALHRLRNARERLHGQ
jgi:glutamyl-tRNA synthetase